MTVFIVLVLTVAAFAFIVYPFFKRKFGIVDTPRDTELQELHSRRDTTYSMLKELEFDYQSGILTEEDYRELEKRYKRKGISILKNIDQLGEGADLDDDIEAQIKKMRRPESEARFCPQCGEKYRAGDRFCTHCGTRLNGKEDSV
ncbi:MAG: zinc-ribbon domain-containing protein [Chloroflexi bacterium]|nr:zinc-ribbon domain-containing protein [Chloroflexota bacterium]